MDPVVWVEGLVDRTVYSVSTTGPKEELVSLLWGRLGEAHEGAGRRGKE